MPERVRFQSAPHGKSRLFGYNYGEYPRHNFRYVNDPGGIYPIWVAGCGMDFWHSKCYRERKFSDTFAIEYVQEGIFVFQQNNITMKVHPGEIFLVHLDTDSSMRCETTHASKKTLILEGGILRQTLNALGLDRVDMISSSEHGQLAHYFDELYELCGQSTQKSRREACVLSYAFLVELAEMATIRQRPRALQRALEYIQEHLDGTLSLEELVLYSGVSSATLHRQFRKFMQTSPVSYYLDQKLERARILLQSRPYSVKEVAEMLNYASSQYFAAEFKKKYGVSPKSFKCRIIS